MITPVFANNHGNSGLTGRKVLAVNTIARGLFLVTLCIPALGQREQHVSVEEAKRLVLAGLPSTAKYLPKFGLDHFPEQDSSQFYFFTASWDNPAGSVVYGNYAVDKVTADVWNAAVACEELCTPELRKLQAKVRLRIGLSNAAYWKVKRRCPLEVEGK